MSCSFQLPTEFRTTGSDIVSRKAKSKDRKLAKTIFWRPFKTGALSRLGNPGQPLNRKVIKIDSTHPFLKVS